MAAWRAADLAMQAVHKDGCSLFVVCYHWPTKYLKRGTASNGVQAHPRKL